LTPSRTLRAVRPRGRPICHRQRCVSAVPAPCGRDTATSAGPACGRNRCRVRLSGRGQLSRGRRRPLPNNLPIGVEVKPLDDVCRGDFDESFDVDAVVPIAQQQREHDLHAGLEPRRGLPYVSACFPSFPISWPSLLVVMWSVPTCWMVLVCSPSQSRCWLRSPRSGGKTFSQTLITIHRNTAVSRTSRSVS